MKPAPQPRKTIIAKKLEVLLKRMSCPFNY
jgi:hypothetical protein